MVSKTPLKFGVTERLSRTFRAESTGIRVEAPKMLWVDSVSTAYLIYRIPYVLIGLRIPEEEWRGKDTCLTHLKVSGCDSFVKVKDVCGKAMKCTFIGNDSYEMRYRFQDTNSHQVIQSRDIKFMDLIYGARSATDSSSFTKPIQKYQVVLVDILENLAENDSIVVEQGLSSEITQSLGNDSYEMRYRFQDTNSHQVIQSRDIKFMDLIYGARSATDSSSFTKPIQKYQVVLVDILENLAENDSIVVEQGLSLEITQSLGGSSDTSDGFENSGSFEDNGRSNEKYYEDGASSKEGGSETPQSEYQQERRHHKDCGCSRSKKSRMTGKLHEPSYVGALNDTSTQYKSKGLQLARQEENLECRLKEILYGLIQAPRLHVGLYSLSSLLLSWQTPISMRNSLKCGLLSPEVVFTPVDRCTRGLGFLIVCITVFWVVLCEGLGGSLKVTCFFLGLGAGASQFSLLGPLFYLPFTPAFKVSLALYLIAIKLDVNRATLEHVASCIVGREAYCSTGFEERIVGCNPNPTSFSTGRAVWHVRAVWHEPELFSSELNNLFGLISWTAMTIIVMDTTLYLMSIIFRIYFSGSGGFLNLDFSYWNDISMEVHVALKTISDGIIQETLAEGTKGAPHLGPERPRVYSDLSPEEKDRETIHAYYVWFAKLINDMRNIKMTMSKMQLNLKFMNNMLPEWGRFMTGVKLKKRLGDSNYDQLYAYLKQHEAHANENTMMSDRFTQHMVDPLALMSNGNNPRGGCAAGYGGAQNIVGKSNLGQARQIKCYSCNGIGNIARNCTQSKHLQNSDYFKDKMLLMQDQENRDLALNVDNVFQADDYDVFDYDVDEAPTAQTMFMANLSSKDPVYDESGSSYDSNIHDHDHYQDVVCEHHEEHEMHDNVQLNHGVDSHADYTSNSNMILYDQYVKDNVVPGIQVDNSLTAKLTTYKEQVELYERRARFELTERKQKIDEKLRIVITDRNFKEETLKKELHSVKLQLASTINHNKLMIEEVTSLKKDFKPKENKYLEDFLDMKSLKEKVEDRLFKQNQSLQTVHMLCRPKPYYNELNKVAIGYKNPLCLTRTKQVQPALYNGHEFIKNNYVPAIVHNTEDTLEIAEITRRKMNDKMKDPKCVKHKVKIAPHDYSKENFLETFTPQKQLTPEQIFWSQDLLKMKTKALKEQTTASRPIKALTVGKGFEQTKECYLKEVILFFKTLKEHFEGIQKALTKEIKEMKDVFKELEAEVAQNVVNRKHDEIERKNLLIANDNLIAECLSKEVFYVAMNSELNVSRFTKMHVANTIVEARCPELEAELYNLRDKSYNDNHNELLNRFSNLEDNVIKQLKKKISHLQETRSEADRTLDFRALDSQFTQLTKKVTVLQAQNDLFRAENGKIKQHYKELYDSIKITCAKHIEQVTALTTENVNLKAQILNNVNSVSKDHVKPTVLAPGTDNRAPMLEENDYESWKIRMKRYIRSKPQGKAIWKSIMEGPAPHPMTAAVTGVANVVVEAPSQGLPRHIFNTLNQTESAKEMWENIKLLMKGSGLSEQRKQEELFDEYERFRAIENEYIHEYFIHFHKLANDLKITKIKIPTHQHNTKFLNNLPSYWANGFQKQFPPTNNQLRTSSNPRSHATVHEGQIVTETIQRKAPGNVSNAGTKGNQGYGKKTDRNGKKYYKDKMMLSDAKDRGVILDAKFEAFLTDVECTEPYDESLALTTTTAFQFSHEDAYNSNVDDGPHAAAAFCHPLRKQMENSLLKTTLFNKEESIKALNKKNKKVVSEKKDIDERNLEEIVCLQKANRVMSDLLKTYQQPTRTIPMLSKRPNIATSDMHKTALGSSNPKYSNIGRESHPAIYDGNRLLDPTHVPSSVWETEETIALGAKSRAKMFEKPGTVKLINYDVLNNSYIKFVPQKELSCEQVYCLKLLFPGLDPIIFQHTKNKHPSVSHECFNHTQQAIETQFLPFLNMFKKLVYQFEEVLVKEVKEFEKFFDELDDEYEQGVKKIKSIEITNRNLVREIECLTSDSIANDVYAIVRTADVRMPLDAEISSSYVRELSKGLELEAEIAKKNKMLSE
nr:retrovirus-related Pol polyprotein from transposon TNT 1-94 [Tanacetum cinerariifolium]